MTKETYLNRSAVRTNKEVYVMNADGSNQLRLTNALDTDDAPYWSPDGTKIIFRSDRERDCCDPTPQLWSMNADGSNQTLLTSNSYVDYSPSWTVTGNQPPVANPAGPYTAMTSQAVQFNGSGSFDPDGSITSYSWNFGDNTSGSGVSPTHAYASVGTYTVTLTVTDNLWSQATTTTTVTITNQPPVANAGGPYSGQTATAIQFNGGGSYDPDGSVVSYAWNFGDGATGSGLAPTHAYSTAGTYNITLTVTDNLGSQASATATATITNQPPVAHPGGPYSGMAGQAVQFNGNGSFDPDGSITSYAWNFGDNTSGSGLSPTHSYSSAGTYTVTLTVTDNLGSQASATTSATITNTQPPVANAGGPYNGMTGQAVQFNGSASFDPDGSITSYAWNFGDNTSGSGVSPTHVYNSVGTFTVTLTVTDNHGLQASATTTATISTNSMEAYAANFSQWALLRQPTPSESVYWNDIFRAAYQNGQGSLLLAVREFGRTLFDSAEYAARGRSDRDYVYDLYKTYLMREPDQGGWDGWTALVPTHGREQVRGGFEYSVEFINLMSTMTANGSITSAVSSLPSARVDPKNQPGNGLLTRDAEWSLPLLSLPGRNGLDLGLSLSYSSQVWTRSGPYLYFDEDTGSPSPGFRLGFPTLQGKWFDAQTGKNVYVLITSGGRRVELRQVGTSNVYEAGDSSYLQLIDNGSLLVRSADGTQMSYGWFNLEFRCTEIKDRNGNYLTINYNWLGDITTITDTLGRTITFNYDTNANLISITQSWTVSGIPQTHNWVTFGWGTHTMASGFSSVSVVGAPNGSTLPVLTQVGMHDGSRYNFEYTGAGQVNVIRRFTSDNVQRAYTTYDYQSTSDDCPRLSATRVWADNWTGINGVPYEVVTQYSELGDGSHQVIAPDGTVYKEFYGGAGSSPAWQRGLVVQSEVWSAGVRQKWTTLNWTQDNTAVNYKTNPRVTESNVYDASGNRRRVTIDYGQYAQYGLPYLVREYAADGLTEIRHNFTDYNLSQAYLDRRIIGLVSEIHVTDVGSWQAKITYGYDDPARIQALPAAATQHDGSYSTAFTTRGNVTSVSRWDVTDIINPSKALTTQMTYNTAGGVVSSSDPMGHQKSVTYADSFSDGNNGRNTFAYPTTITDGDNFSSYVQYNFDFGAHTRIQGPPPAGQPQGLIQTLIYDAAARIERVTTTNNGAYTRYVYGPNYIATLGSVNNLADEAYSIHYFSGVGQRVATAGNHPGSAGGYRAQLTYFDQRGRMMLQSNPTEITGSWVPSGDDAAGWLYTNQTYDWQGRPLITTNTDGTTKEASYGGCGCAGGEVVTLTDEGTVDAGVFKRRQQKVYSDVLGRPVKTEVLNWQGGSVYSATVNTYNARDQITLVRQYSGAEGSSTYQDTSMTYDGYGRLKTKHLPQQDAGTATTWNYNSDNTVLSVIDARGASQTFTYNGRHLVADISHDASSGITIPAPSTFGYDAAGNRILMSDASGSTNYQYNQLSQLQTETREFGGLFGSYTLSYEYNLAGMLTKITDPSTSSISYGYDAASRLNYVGGADNLYGGVSQYASGASYRAWGGIKGLTYGNNYSLAVNYNSRLQGTQFEISGRPAQFGTSTVMKTQFEYYPDGATKYAHDLLDERFDRAFSYDHVAMFKDAYSGSEARDFVNGTNSGTPTGPFRQSYLYDVFGNMTQRDNRVWSRTDAFTASYANYRNVGFGYDADGRLRQDDDLHYVYDAAGRNVSIHSGHKAARLPQCMMATDGWPGERRHRAVAPSRPIMFALLC